MWNYHGPKTYLFYTNPSWLWPERHWLCLLAAADEGNDKLFKISTHSIDLPVDTSNNYNDYEATVSGWGTLSNDVEKGSSKLMEVNVKVMTNFECRNKLRYHYSWITEQMLCANGFRMDACKGDSGIDDAVKVIRVFLYILRGSSCHCWLWVWCDPWAERWADWNHVLGIQLCDCFLPRSVI